jgi:hypothetical protein
MRRIIIDQQEKNRILNMYVFKTKKNKLREGIESQETFDIEITGPDKETGNLSLKNIKVDPTDKCKVIFDYNISGEGIKQYFEMGQLMGNEGEYSCSKNQFLLESKLGKRVYVTNETNETIKNHCLSCKV